MKILLIFPPARQSVTKLAKILEDRIPPLGIAYVAAALERKGHQVKIIDADTEGLDLEKLGKLALGYQPQVIGISTLTPTFKKARQTARCLKKLLPQVPIIFGGPHLASFPKISLEFPEIDYGVIDEGEITICELLDALEQNKSVDQVKGVVYRKEGKIIQTKPRELIQDLDSIEFPAWHLLPMDKYWQTISREKKFATMISSRGCPFNCLFCDPEGRLGKKFRGRSSDNIVKEIELLYNNYGIKEIVFYDDTFTFDRQRIVDFSKLMIEKKLPVIWECRTRVDRVDEELLKIMKKAGCYRIRYGVESGNEKILQVLRKGITKEQVRKAFSFSKRYKIETFAYFMIGSPQEDKETIQDTINFVLELDPDFVIFSTTLVFNKGNDLFKWAAQKGYIANDYWQRFVRGEDLDPYPVLETDNLSKEEKLAYTQLAYRRFYIRPSFILKKLKEFRHPKRFFKYSLVFFQILLNRVKN